MAWENLFTFSADAVDVDMSLSPASGAHTSAASINLGGVCSDATAVVEVSVSGTLHGTSSCDGATKTWSYTAPLAIEGTNILSVSHATVNGTMTDSRSYVRDTTAPTVNLAALSSPAVAGTTIVFRALFSDSNPYNNTIAAADLSGHGCTSASISNTSPTQSDITLTGCSTAAGSTVTLNIAAGVFTDNAGNASPAASASVTIVHGAATSLSITGITDGTSITAGTSLSANLELKDTYGNTATSVTDSISAGLVGFAAGDVPSVSTTGLTSGAGTAGIGPMYRAGGPFSVSFTTGGITASRSFYVVPGPSARYRFTEAPTFLAPGNCDAAHYFEVRREDTYGNLVLNATETLALGSTVAGSFSPTCGSAAVTSINFPANSAFARFYFTGTAASTQGILSATNSGKVAETPVGVVNGGGVHLEVPIELTDHGLALTTSAQIFNSTNTDFDSSQYTSAVNGGVQYYLEIVAENRDRINAQSVLLTLNNFGLTDTEIVVPPTKNPTRFVRGLPGFAATGALRLKLARAVAGLAVLNVFSARLLVRQYAATSTRLQIPLVGDLASRASSITSFSILQHTVSGPEPIGHGLSVNDSSRNGQDYLTFFKPPAVLSSPNGESVSTILEVVSSSADTPTAPTAYLYDESGNSSGIGGFLGAVTASPTKSLFYAGGFNPNQRYRLKFGSSSAVADTGKIIKLHKAALWVEIDGINSSSVIDIPTRISRGGSPGFLSEGLQRFAFESLPYAKSLSFDSCARNSSSGSVYIKNHARNDAYATSGVQLTQNYGNNAGNQSCQTTTGLTAPLQGSRLHVNASGADLWLIQGLFIQSYAHSAN